MVKQHMTQDHMEQEHIMRVHMIRQHMAQEPIETQEEVIGQDMLQMELQERYHSLLEELVSKQAPLKDWVTKMRGLQPFQSKYFQLNALIYYFNPE